MTARRRLQAWLRIRRERWLLKREGVDAGAVTLSARRVYILPTRPGLAFAGLLLIMLIGALNYNLGLGFALTFFTGACAVADMVLTTRNLAGLTLAPGRTAPVFAGDEAQFELHLHNPTRRDRFAIRLGFEVATADLAVARGGGGRLEARLHAHHRQVRVARPHRLDGGHGGGVAGHHQRLDAAPEQKFRHGQGALDHELLGLVAIRRVAGIGEVQQMLVRQLRADVAQHRQPAHAGIEHADRRFSRNSRSGRSSHSDRSSRSSLSGQSGRRRRWAIRR